MPEFSIETIVVEDKMALFTVLAGGSEYDLAEHIVEYTDETLGLERTDSNIEHNQRDVVLELRELNIDVGVVIDAAESALNNVKK